MTFKKKLTHRVTAEISVHFFFQIAEKLEECHSYIVLSTIGRAAVRVAFWRSCWQRTCGRHTNDRSRRHSSLDIRITLAFVRFRSGPFFTLFSKEISERRVNWPPTGFGSSCASCTTFLDLHFSQQCKYVLSF